MAERQTGKRVVNDGEVRRGQGPENKEIAKRRREHLRAATVDIVDDLTGRPLAAAHNR
jgi:hypothetical protein